MSEITFVSNKTRSQMYKYFFTSILAIFIWILQVSIFSQVYFFDSTPNLLLLGSIYLGLTLGPSFGIVFGIISSFLSASILYDHSFYFSYPLIGLLAGLFTKNIFSDELLFFILLSGLFTFLFEYLNGWQYSLKNPTDIFNHYLLISPFSSILNLFFAAFFYWVMKYITKKLKLW